MYGAHVMSGEFSPTDPKPRLRWTAELHERFVDAVNQLGGADSKLNLLSSEFTVEISSIKQVVHVTLWYCLILCYKLVIIAVIEV